jgi:hypothetical protein
MIVHNPQGLSTVRDELSTLRRGAFAGLATNCHYCRLAEVTVGTYVSSASELSTSIPNSLKTALEARMMTVIAEDSTLINVRSTADDT